MRNIALIGLLTFVIASAASASPVWYENFEDGLAGWSMWTERGTNTSAAISEVPDLGDPGSTLDNPNDLMAKVGGTGFNGGIYTTVSGLPTNTTLTIDGFWRTLTWPNNNAWAEVIVIPDDTPPPPVNGSDYNVAANLEYKIDSWAQQGTIDGTFSGTAAVKNDGDFTTTTGTVTVILKVGNGSGLSEVAFDDVQITPEPASLALLLLGLPMLRRRR